MARSRRSLAPPQVQDLRSSAGPAINKAFSIEIPDPAARHGDPLGNQEGPFQRLAATVSAQLPACRDDPVAGDAGHAAALHDVSNRARGPGHTRRGRHITVGRHAARWNAPDRSQHALLEIRGFGNRSIS